MAKRKYNESSATRSKRVKTDESTEVESTKNDEKREDSLKETVSDALDVKRTDTCEKYKFDVKYFRKELAGKQGQTMILTQFLQSCLNPDSEVDYISEYLKAGGHSHEILHQMNQENKKNISLAAPTFHIFHLIVLKVQSSFPDKILITEQACQYFLNTFMPTVEIMISENSSPRHRKIILNLFTSMVTLNADLGIEVLNQASLTPKHLQYIVENAKSNEKDDVRTAFVHFITSFLVDGHLPLIKALLEKQGLLALVLPGLINDDPEAVLIFLNLLKTNIIENALIAKSLKLKTFSHQVLHNIFKIYSWKGPSQMNVELRNEMRLEITNMLSDILLILFTNHKLGLYFTDSTLGTGDVNKNQNLYRALLTLNRPWENESLCKTILQIVFKCPDLHRAIIHITEKHFEPCHSPIWERTVTFVLKLIETFKPENMISRISDLNSHQVINLVRFLTLPVPLLKIINNNIGKDSTIDVYCVKVLVKMLQTLKQFINILELENSQVRIADLKNKLDHFLPKHLPRPNMIVSLIHSVINNRKDSKKENNETDYTLTKHCEMSSMINIIDLLILYHDVHPTFFELIEGTLDPKLILNFCATLSGEHISLLKFKVVSLWLLLDNSLTSVSHPMFKDLLLIILEVYTSDTSDLWIEVEQTLHDFLKNTEIFENDENEVSLVLYTLRHSQINSLQVCVDVIGYVLENIKELTEYIKNQIVNFEITDDNAQRNLDELFKNLSENKNTDNDIFLESNIPSPFVVGCIQYIQNNKNDKKQLKSFLSIYIANLLHSNYSPELTEILIGDCKLEARSYVANWISDLTILDETLSGSDKVIQLISQSVLSQDDIIPLEKIFSYFEVTSDDECDLTVNNTKYRIRNNQHVNSSALLIWAKFLIFCIIRLTVMNKLDDVQQKKITDCFNCLIAIGKKNHLFGVCRTIVSTLLKNPHLLKIYKPLNFHKSRSFMLSTKFIIQCIADHSDIIKYLDNSDKALRPFQIKNSKEILKALIKTEKGKYVGTELLPNVIETVGLTKEDNLNILGEIVSKNAIDYVKDCKEQSFILVMLVLLLERCSKPTSVELTNNVLKNVLSLYFTLLTNKDISLNLSDLENSLIVFFECKPQKVKLITEADFQHFFFANSVRKSTSNLASVLLKQKYNFCNVFMKQISRPEILCSREITLPLGNAILNHNQFLIENKSFLFTIFDEYKSNILKFMEKPHKTSQLYLSSWKFIRKLILECMDVKDCQNFFSKFHKFEIVENRHLNIVHIVFLKYWFKCNDYNGELLNNYLLTSLHTAANALKEENNNMDVKCFVSNFNSVCKICWSMDNFQVKQKQYFKKVIESSTWKNYCKIVLKESLNVKKADLETEKYSYYLHQLLNLVKLLYTENHQDLETLFDMVTSHSEFLNVMLSYHNSEIKLKVLEILYTITVMNNTVIKTQLIPVYLSAYHATRSPCDRLILSLLHYYECHGQPVNDYKPYLWGNSASNYYSVRKNKNASLWSHPTPNQVINLLEKDKIEKTISKFPVMQTLDYKYEIRNIDDVDVGFKNSIKDLLDNMTKEGILKSPSIKNEEEAINKTVKGLLDNMNKYGIVKMQSIKDNEEALKGWVAEYKFRTVITKSQQSDLTLVSHLSDTEDIYDPSFILPLLSHLLAPGSVTSCFRLLRSGLLSIPVMALSSHCPLMRAAAYHVLHRYFMLLEIETRHKNDKLLLSDFMNTLKCSLSSAIRNGKENPDASNPQIPAISALYLAKGLMVSTAPFHPLYKPVNNFLIAKQFIDLSLVPDFLSLFHGSDVEFIERRLWILDIIKDGTKAMIDVNVIFRSMCLKMIMDFYTSVLCDRKTKASILEVISRLISVPRAMDILVEGYGLLPWLNTVVALLERNDELLLSIVNRIIVNIIDSVRVNFYVKSVNIRTVNFNTNKNTQ